MRRHPIWRYAMAALAFGGAAPALAAPAPVPAASDMDALAAAVPPQSWYPDGYYDVRIAAEAEIADSPRPAAKLLFDGGDGKGPTYDIYGCGAQQTDRTTSDPMLRRYGDLALTVARLRSEFARLHYPAAVYAEPLLAFERARLAPATDAADTPKSPYAVLIEAADANRLSLSPSLPGFGAVPDCPTAPIRSRTGAVRSGNMGGLTVFATMPKAGAIWMIDAFAFKVCQRRKVDAWDRFACRWNEVETGAGKRLSGRYIYQVRWPDGVVRKGTREIVPDSASEKPATVMFRKTGS